MIFLTQLENYLKLLFNHHLCDPIAEKHGEAENKNRTIKIDASQPNFFDQKNSKKECFNQLIYLNNCGYLNLRSDLNKSPQFLSCLSFFSFKNIQAH